MALAFVQAAQNHTATAAATTVTMTNPTTAGNLLVGLTSQLLNNTQNLTLIDGSDGSSISSWTQTASGYSPQSTTKRCTIWLFPNCTVLTTVKFTWGAISTTIDGMVFEISGAATSSAEDTSVNANGGLAALSTSGTFTTTNANDILILGTCIGGTYTAPSAGAGYTIPTNGSSTTGDLIMSYDIVSGTVGPTTTTHTWSTSHSWANVFVAIKALAVAANTPGWASPTGVPSFAI